MALHGRARRFGVARSAIAVQEFRACSRWKSSRLRARAIGAAVPHTVPARNDEAAEVLEKAPELRVAGGVGDGAVEGEVLVDGDSRRARSPPGSASNRSPIFLICAGVARSAREPGGLDFDARAQLHDVEHVAQRTSARRSRRGRGGAPGRRRRRRALAREHQPVGAQRRHRLAHDGAADAGRRDHFLLGRQPRAGRELAAGYVGGQPRDEFGGEPTRRVSGRSSARFFGERLGKGLDTGGGGQVII